MICGVESTIRDKNIKFPYPALKEEQTVFKENATSVQIEGHFSSIKKKPEFKAANTSLYTKLTCRFDLATKRFFDGLVEGHANGRLTHKDYTDIVTIAKGNPINLVIHLIYVRLNQKRDQVI